LWHEAIISEEHAIPFVSESQRRKFYSTPSLQEYVAEFEQGTPKKLPERVRPPKPIPTQPKRQSRHTAITAMLAAGGNHRGGKR
jgi:hypothetical protein